MENILINSFQVIIAGCLAYLSLRYWKRSLNKKFKLDTESSAYILFSSVQVLSILSIVFLSIDQEVLTYLEVFSLIGDNSAGLWAFWGVQLLSTSVLYVIINMLAHVFYSITFQTQRGMHAEIELGKWKSLIPYFVFFIGSVWIASSFILKPILVQWLANDSALIPLY